MGADEPQRESSLDTLFGGKVKLLQPRRGHRAGTDAVLLAAAAETDACRIIDLGAGVGAVGIAAALASPTASLTLVEIDPATAGLARLNLALNGLEERGRVVEADVLASAKLREAAGLAPRCADLVLTNPPFDAERRGRGSPDAARRLAHIMPEGGLTGWLRAAAHLLQPGGALVMIHRADAIPTVLEAMTGRFGALRLIFVHPTDRQPANRLLIRGTLGSRAPLSVLPPLIVHGGSQEVFTAEAKALHEGEARLDWERGGLAPR